jgi:hypothetical protein
MNKQEKKEHAWKQRLLAKLAWKRDAEMLARREARAKALKGVK